MSPSLEKLLPTLVGAGVEFINVGGVAGILHGSARATYDVDLVYSRNEQNIQRLASVLAPYKPYLRNAQVSLRSYGILKTIHHGLNFTLTTDLGDIALLGEVSNGTYQTFLPHSLEVEAFGVRFKCIDLPTLIRIKEAAGRRKDLEAIAELKVLLEEIAKKHR